MIRLISSTDSESVARLDGWHRVSIDVLDNNQVFVGSSKQDLNSSGAGFLGGLPVDKNHPYREWVYGELWLIGSVDNTAINLLIWPSNTSTV